MAGVLSASGSESGAAGAGESNDVDPFLSFSIIKELLSKALGVNCAV